MAERDDRELSPEEQAAAEAQAAKRRKRLIYGVIAAAVLVLVLGGIIIWLLLREPDPEIQAAQGARNPKAVDNRAIYTPLGRIFRLNSVWPGRHGYHKWQGTLRL